MSAFTLGGSAACSIRSVTALPTKKKQASDLRTKLLAFHLVVCLHSSSIVIIAFPFLLIATVVEFLIYLFFLE